MYQSSTAGVDGTGNTITDPTVTLISVTSDEPDNGLGDGDTPDDIVIVDDFHFLLRAERSRKHPPVLLGGPLTTSNALPFGPFIAVAGCDLAAQETAALLNDYFECVIDAVHAHGGQVLDHRRAPLPEAVAFAVIDFITGPLRENPRRVGAALRNELQGVWSARRGTYRILYRIDDQRREVIVLRVGHRRGIYRPR